MGFPTFWLLLQVFRNRIELNPNPEPGKALSSSTDPRAMATALSFLMVPPKEFTDRLVDLL